MDWMRQSKDIEWKTGYKKKKKSAYNILPVQRPSSGQRMHIDWKWGDGEIYFTQTEMAS